ncbi:MAG: restriction endonuclease subunit S [bacterium]|nr:restriction endonuclease subunit S [bacterium]
MNEYIPKGWKRVKLGEVIKVKHGYAFKGKYITDKETDAIIVTPGNFKIGGGFKSSKFKYFNFEYPKEYILKEGDIVVTMTDLSKDSDTLGYAAKIPSIKNKILLHNQRIGLVEFINNEVSKDFIYWLMRTTDYHWYCVSSASGTSIMHTSPSRIANYEFYLPPLHEQKAITSVLSSLDDKIDLLHRQNQTLEKMAETLFRQWFIEEAKEDWEEVKLGDFFPVKTGKKNANFATDDGKYPFFTCSQEVLRAPFYTFEGYAILLAGNGDFNVKRYKGKFEAYQRTYVLIPYEDLYVGFLYTLIKYFLPEITGSYQGSVINFITKGMIENFSFTLPSNRKTDEKFKSKLQKINLIYEKIDFNIKQIRTLEQLRDTLLPKLMSGEVRVKI